MNFNFIKDYLFKPREMISGIIITVLDENDVILCKGHSKSNQIVTMIGLVNGIAVKTLYELVFFGEIVRMFNDCDPVKIKKGDLVDITATEPCGFITLGEENGN